ncbi:MAG: hypothetical protein D3909_13355 [Candidatus Electrothrix sp. ATG1]|nr:hypothetical protein [Candidatus Electrothrix sp. ATG1]MCI5208728.1 hypothetical protein [Candidatus Electrothrix sp. ATG2]
MADAVSFHEVLDAVEQLPIDEQESLIDLIRRRIAEYRRQEIATQVSSAREEYKNGKLIPESPDDIMQSILP